MLQTYFHVNFGVMQDNEDIINVSKNSLTQLRSYRCKLQPSLSLNICWWSGCVVFNNGRSGVDWIKQRLMS